MTSKLNDLTAKELLALLQERKCTVSQVTLDCMNQIKRIDQSINAWVHIDPELIARNASKLEKKLEAGQPVGKMYGIPVGIKDVFNTIDMPTQMGSPIWKDFQPGNDARVVHYLKMADALSFGKTVTAEFAVHAPGPTKNPHNVHYAPGTSSSGSAAAVSARMVPVALGTQTAGSILRPASYCGIYGYKPSFGLVPRTATLKTTDSLDTIGGFARCIDDIALLFETIRVHGRDYPVSETALNDPSRREKLANRPWKVGLVRGPKWHHAESYAQEAIYKYADKLASVLPVEVEEVELPSQFNSAHEVHSTIYDKTLAYYFQREFSKNTLVSPIMNEIVRRGITVTPAQYISALEEQKELFHQLDDFIEGRFDFLLGLTTGGEALRNEEAEQDRPDNCLIWTLCGVPALNLPVFEGPLGLPFGAQLISRRFNDYLLLNFARMLEEAQLAGTVTYPRAATSDGALAFQTPVQATSLENASLPNS